MKRNAVTRTAGAMPEAGTNVAWTAEVTPSAAGGVTLPVPTPYTGRMSIGGPQPVAPPSAMQETQRLRTTIAGDAPATGVEFPVRNGATYTYTTASLTGDEGPASQLEEMAGAPVPAAVPAPPRSAKASKPARRTANARRSVHQLFTHPLGRM
jgi:hypothetical protein